ncbi:MAG TPA: hypothetical protein VNS58_06715 [Puia sp.]|nr:hypothetical protein [Puia sp.]
MNSTQKVRLRRLNIRLSQEEWDKVHRFSSNTTCRSISEYARKILLNKPVKVFYRNQSFDHFEEQMTRLLPLLETISDNFDQLAKKITPLKTIPELKSELNLVLFGWESLIKKINEIKTLIEKIADHETQNNAL